MAITQIQFVITRKGVNFIFVKVCAIGNRKESYSVRKEGTKYKDAKQTSASIFNKYMKILKETKEAAV